MADVHAIRTTAPSPAGWARSSGEELIARYQRSGDPRAMERAVVHYLPLARKLAARYRRRPEPFEDLVQVASLGLVKAIKRYDAARGARFSSFAVPTITGELRRHFRGTAWNLHVPRGVQEDVLSVREATTRLSHRLGRAPRVSELEHETGLDAEAIAEALHARDVQATTSLDKPSAGRDGDEAAPLSELIGALDAGFDRAEHAAALGPRLRALPVRERQVLFLRFARDMTQSEIAARVGCSQMQVSRILRRTIEQLSAEVAAPADPPTPPARPPA